MDNKEKKQPAFVLDFEFDDYDTTEKRVELDEVVKELEEFSEKLTEELPDQVNDQEKNHEPVKEDLDKSDQEPEDEMIK